MPGDVERVVRRASVGRRDSEANVAPHSKPEAAQAAHDDAWFRIAHGTSLAARVDLQSEREQ